MPAELSWSGWGDPAEASELPAAVGELLRTGLGVTRATPAPRTIDELSLVAPRLPRAVAERLGATVGAANARGDHASRARHALGRSTLDLLALRANAPLPAPDLVVTPASHDEVMDILGICSEARVAVVPFGGGTSVVGGVTPDTDGFAGWVALDLVRLDAVHDVDAESRLARLGPGLRGPDAEARLGSAGLHDRPLPAIVRVREPRRLRGRPLERTGLGGLRALRRSRRGAAGRHPVGRARPRAARPSPRPARTCASSCSAPRAHSGSSPS